MKVVWADSNVLLRFLTKRPPDQWRRADAFLRMASEHKLIAHVPVVVVAEVMAVLHHSFDLRIDEAARLLSAVLTADGVRTEDEAAVLEALRLSETVRVDLADAYVAIKARDAGEPVASFDADFSRKLGATPYPLNA